VQINVQAHLNSGTEEEDDVFDKDWIWLGAEKDTDFSSYKSLDSGLLSISSIYELCDKWVSGRSSGKRKRDSNESLN